MCPEPPGVRTVFPVNLEIPDSVDSESANELPLKLQGHRLKARWHRTAAPHHDRRAQPTKIEPMNDGLPSRLELLRFLQRVQLQQLDQTRRWIEQEEVRLTAQPQREVPPPPEWKLERERLGGRDAAPVYVHLGDCGMGKGGGLTREQALRAIAEGVGACPYCRPDTALGIID